MTEIIPANNVVYTVPQFCCTAGKICVTLGPCMHSIRTIYCVGEVWIGADCMLTCVSKRSPSDPNGHHNVETSASYVCNHAKQSKIASNYNCRISKCMYFSWHAYEHGPHVFTLVAVGLCTLELLHSVTHPILIAQSPTNACDYVCMYRHVCVACLCYCVYMYIWLYTCTIM